MLLALKNFEEITRWNVILEPAEGRPPFVILILMLTLAQYADLLSNLLETLQELVDRRGFYPFDRKFYPLVSAVCFHLQMVVDPEKTAH